MDRETTVAEYLSYLTEKEHTKIAICTWSEGREVLQKLRMEEVP